MWRGSLEAFAGSCRNLPGEEYTCLAHVPRSTALGLFVSALIRSRISLASWSTQAPYTISGKFVANLPN